MTGAAADDWDGFRHWYIEGGGSARSAASYLTYLRAVERVTGSVRGRCEASAHDEFLKWIARQPDSALGGAGYARHARSALRHYAAFHFSPSSVREAKAALTTSQLRATSTADLMHLLREAQSLGARYYRATGKPLGVTGEVAELEAADKLGLQLCPARTAAFDAIDPRNGRTVQIKGRAVDLTDRYRGMCPAIRCDPAVDEVALVLLDRETLCALEIWTAPMPVVAGRIANLMSDRRRDNGTLAITQFRSIAARTWSAI